ncbi:MAG: hypothetical protein ACRCS8_01545 [Brevinema sp.]
MKAKLSILMLLSLGSCAYFAPSLEKSDDVYLYEGREKVIVSFAQEPSKDTLNQTAKAISFLSSRLPNTLSEESFVVEGLSGEFFPDFFRIADYMFLSTSLYKNKTLIYAHISSLYYEFMTKNKEYAFIPIKDFQNLVGMQSPRNYELLYKHAVQYAVDDIFFVSILEFMERPDRYFFARNTSGELFKTLIYPEILTFWQYMEFRFGTKMLLDFAQKPYTPEDFHITFGEKIADIENTYVKQLANNIQNTSLTNIQSELSQYTKLYMAGTKKNLMSE